MGVMSTEEEQHHRYAEEKFLRRGVLIAIVNLLPQIQVIVRAGVEFKWDPSDPMEHEVRAKHVRDIGQCPGGLLRHPWDDVEEDLQCQNEHYMYSPCS